MKFLLIFLICKKLQGKEDDIRKDLFHIFYTNSKVFLPPLELNYNSSGEYLWYKQVNVEPRARVKYMSLSFGRFFFNLLYVLV
jgi:hypothetical protein